MKRINPFAVPQSRVLIAFISAHHPSRLSHVAAQRERMRNSPLPYVFVYGDRLSQSEPLPDRAPEKDELFLSANDTRFYMVEKDKQLFAWALSRGYDFVFRACDDSIVYPARIMSNFEQLRQHDYAGTMCGYGSMNVIRDGKTENGVFTLKYLDYMHGGVGIWLSARAMRMLVADPWQGPYSSPYSNNIEIAPGNYFKGSWGIYWDDLWIGEVLKGNLNYNDPRRNEIYDNYLVHVWDNPELFASNTPFDESRVIATHSLEQMGSSDLKPQPFSTRWDMIPRVVVDWTEAKSEFHAISPK